MVERVNGNQSLGSYMRRHIWEPLGMSATTFRPETLPGLEERVAEMTMRGPDGGLTPGRTQDIRGSCLDDEGGGGAYSSPRDYTTLLVSLLKNDGTLLEPASVEVLLSPGLTDAAAKALKAIISTRFTTADAAGEVDSTLTGGVIAPSEVDYAPGGMVALADVPGGRKAGSVSWGGLPNLSWVLDRATGTALFYASQLMPTGDKDTRDVFKKFEAVVYAESS
jgi:CubicO group peptidase (beta-lactamase class C family)